MRVVKELEHLIRSIRITGWIALIATLVLIVQLNLIVTEAWGTLDTATQLQIFGITLMVVLVFGFSRASVGGMWKTGKRR